MGTSLHVASWIIAFVLLFSIIFLYNKNNDRVANIIHMILRLFYIFILITGIQLLWPYFQGGTMLLTAIIKGFVGIWLIGAMEMVSVRFSKNEDTRGAWIQVAISFVITLILGYGILSM